MWGRGAAAATPPAPTPLPPPAMARPDGSSEADPSPAPTRRVPGAAARVSPAAPGLVSGAAPGLVFGGVQAERALLEGKEDQKAFDLAGAEHSEEELAKMLANLTDEQREELRRVRTGVILSGLGFRWLPARHFCDVTRIAVSTRRLHIECLMAGEEPVLSSWRARSAAADAVGWRWRYALGPDRNCTLPLSDLRKCRPFDGGALATIRTVPGARSRGWLTQPAWPGRPTGDRHCQWSGPEAERSAAPALTITTPRRLRAAPLTAPHPTPPAGATRATHDTPSTASVSPSGLAAEGCLPVGLSAVGQGSQLRIQRPCASAGAADGGGRRRPDGGAASEGRGPGGPHQVRQAGAAPACAALRHMRKRPWGDLRHVITIPFSGGGRRRLPRPPAHPSAGVAAVRRSGCCAMRSAGLSRS